MTHPIEGHRLRLVEAAQEAGYPQLDIGRPWMAEREQIGLAKNMLGPGVIPWFAFAEQFVDAEIARVLAILDRRRQQAERMSG